MSSSLTLTAKMLKMSQFWFIWPTTFNVKLQSLIQITPDIILFLVALKSLDIYCSFYANTAFIFLHKL